MSLVLEQGGKDVRTKGRGAWMTSARVAGNVDER